MLRHIVIYYYCYIIIKHMYRYSWLIVIKESLAFASILLPVLTVNTTNKLIQPCGRVPGVVCLSSVECDYVHILSVHKLKLNRRSRWVNVPSSSQPPGGEKTLSTSASSSSLVTNTGSVSSDSSVHTTVSNGHNRELTDQKDKERVSVSSENDSSEKLTVTREEMVKGVVIKGIVCNPKNSQKSKSSASLNPFEKRLAPKPPASVQSDSVPKTKSKSKSRGGSRNWNVLYKMFFMTLASV